VRKTLLTAALFAAMATGAHAQNRTQSLLQPNSTTTVLPVWGTSGQVEALLVIEPSTSFAAGRPVLGPSPQMLSSDRGLRFSGGFDAGKGSAGSLGLFCNGGAGLLTSLDALASHCRFGSTQNGGSFKAQAGLERGKARVSVNAGIASSQAVPGRSGLAGLPTGFDTAGTFSTATGSQLNQRYLGLDGSLRLGDQGWVSIGGTLAKARLIPSGQAAGQLPNEWNSGSISVGGGRGSIGGEVTGTVVAIPGQAETFRSVGAGVTWRTPWRAKLSVGADNLMTRGKNPLEAVGRDRASTGNDVDGAVPFVRYEQDL
jgi:hypothetical protein